jgi:hypothetical protein
MAQSNTGIARDRWVHLAGVRRRGAIYLYFDGGLARNGVDKVHEAELSAEVDGRDALAARRAEGGESIVPGRARLFELFEFGLFELDLFVFVFELFELFEFAFELGDTCLSLLGV